MTAVGGFRPPAVVTRAQSAVAVHRGRLSPKLILATVARGNLEWLVTDRFAFGLTTATPLQRAICRIAEGKPLAELSTDPSVVTSLGGASAVAALPDRAPHELVILGAVRSAKSLLSAAAAVRWSQTIDLSLTRRSESPRIAVCSLDKDKASVVLDDHLCGTLQSSPFLRGLLIDEPSGDAVSLRHPTGRAIEVKVVAGRRQGGAVVSRWSAGAIFDEAPRMLGQDDAIINLDEARRSLQGRTLPGAHIWYVGSPDAPFGPVYEMCVEHFGRPSARMVVLRCRGPDMNPSYWTEERCEQVRSNDPDAYRTDVCAEFLTPEESLFSNVVLERCSRKDMDVAARPECTYTAAMDPATRGNAWTLVVGTRQGRMKRVVLARQWAGSGAEPLSPRAVARDMAMFCRPYGVRQIETDQYYVDALADIFREVGLGVAQAQLTDQDKTEAYLAVRAKMVEGEVELPPDAHLQADLRRVRRRATQRGVSIVLPHTGDGRHCDYAPALMLLLRRWCKDERPPLSPEQEAEEREKTLAKVRLDSADSETKRLRSWMKQKFAHRKPGGQY